MSFREFTNHECQLSRDIQPTESARTALESKVLQSLDGAKAQFLQSGGSVKQLPAMSLSSELNYAEMNRVAKARQTKRNEKHKLKQG